MTDNIDDGGMLMPEPGGPEPEKKPRAARPTPPAEAKPSAGAAVPRAVPAADEDLSAEIIRTVAREPGEQVTCRRVSKNHYRCNWWRPQTLGAYDNPLMGGLLVTTNRICKSHFLRVIPAIPNVPATGDVVKAGRLSITVVPER